MLSFNSFWNNLFDFVLKHHQFSLLLSFLLIILISLWRWQPIDRKSIFPALLFFIIAVCGFVISDVMTALNIKPFSGGLYEISIFASGMAVIRLLGLLLFRLILPLCRFNLLSILEDLVELAGYGAWLIIYLHNSGLELSDIVTTSAVMTAVLAFAMQDTLGNLLGGLALQLDSSIKVGDWIKMDDVNGRVTDIRWRYTAIETRNWETVIIPNSLLMKGKLSVLGRRSGKPIQWRRMIYFDVGYEHSSGQVIDIAQQAVRHGHIANVANTPPANCVLIDFTPSTARYILRYWLTNIEVDDATDSAVRIRIHAALQRAGIKLPYPQYNIHLTNRDDKYENNKKLRRVKERIEALRRVELFNTLSDDEIIEIAEQLVYTPFAQGDIIMRQGEIADWLYIITNGVVEVVLEMTEGERRHIDTLHSGSFLGEMGLMTGNPRSATAIAKSEILTYRLDKASFQKVLDKRPEIAVEISNLLVSRRFNIDNLQQLDDKSAAQLIAQAQKNFLAQIRSFFRL